MLLVLFVLLVLVFVGCTLSATITAHLAEGRALEEAVREAKGFITEAIRSAPADIGAGHGPLDHMWGLKG